jgi:hypothetical protein
MECFPVHGRLYCSTIKEPVPSCLYGKGLHVVFNRVNKRSDAHHMFRFGSPFFLFS